MGSLEISPRPHCPHVHLIHRRCEMVYLSVSLSSVLDQCRNRNNKDYFNRNRKMERSACCPPPSWIMMSCGVWCFWLACEETRFRADRGRIFSCHFSRIYTAVCWCTEKLWVRVPKNYGFVTKIWVGVPKIMGCVPKIIGCMPKKAKLYSFKLLLYSRMSKARVYF